MKKTYQAPQVKEYIVQLDHQLLTSSNITPNGSSQALMLSEEDAEEEEEARAKANSFGWIW